MKVTDQMNRIVTLSNNTERIVSLVPSQTELLVDLGLENKLVGVTKFCIHPKGLKQKKTIIGGTKNFDFEKIKELNPDLIIGNKEENYQEGIEEPEKQFPVWMSDIYNLTDAKTMIQEIGKITNTKEKSIEIVNQIKQEETKLNDSDSKNALYFIWRNPYMVAGSNNYINEMLRLNGYLNLCNSSDYSRYPELTEDEIKNINPETILLSSEPFPFKEKHVEELKQLLPNTEIKIVDGELYSWYGSRIIKALKLFNTNGNRN